MYAIQKKRSHRAQFIHEMLLMHLGVLILAVGVYFFKFPNHFTMGGVAGMSVVFSAMLPQFSPSVINFILNMILLALGFAYFGKGFGVKTTYASMLMSLLILFFERICPLSGPISTKPVLELFFAAFLPALGSAILFNISASSGGTDVLAKIVQDRSSLDIGMALLATDSIFSISTIYFFGTETFLFSVAGLLTKGVLVDTIIEGFNRVKAMTIATSEPEKVGEFIKINLHRGATVVEGKGLFSGEERTIFICVVNRYQAVLLRNYSRSVDPHAFILIQNTSEIVGRGFRHP